MHEDVNNLPLKHSPWEVLVVFLQLGLTSFGGPVAHLGYFYRELVQKRAWVSESQYAQLLAVCQFLPGPASSQLGFALGLLRAGWRGALAAFAGFTLPSVVLLLGFASLLPLLQGEVALAVLHGLKLLACAVVADAVLSMWQKLCSDWVRRAFAVVAVVVVMLAGAWGIGTVGQVLAVVLAALAGFWCCRPAALAPAAQVQVNYGRGVGAALLLLFLVLLVGLGAMGVVSGVAEAGVFTIADAFYRAGALVFGGGHVVLPLLQTSVVDSGWVSEADFLAGYGAAQIMPGPLFAFAAYLGALIPAATSAYVTATIALLCLFLPGFLLVTAVLPLWQRFAVNPRISGAVAGVNAAVVGVLAAALYDPILRSGVGSWVDLAIVVVGFALLAVWRLSPLWVVAWCVAASTLTTLLF